MQHIDPTSLVPCPSLSPAWWHLQERPDTVRRGSGGWKDLRNGGRQKKRSEQARDCRVSILGMFGKHSAYSCHHGHNAS